MFTYNLHVQLAPGSPTAGAIPIKTKVLFVLFLLFVLYTIGQSVFMYSDYAYFGNDPFAVYGRRCPVYVYHIGPLAVEDRVECNLPWALTVRTR